MSRMKNMVGAFVIFYACVTLLTSAWGGFNEGYDIDEQELNGGKNVLSSLKDINFIAGISDFSNGISKLTTISADFDLIGGLALSGSGVLQIIGGIVTFPLDISKAILPHYGFIVPPVITEIIGFLVVLSVGFVLLSAKMGFDL